MNKISKENSILQYIHCKKCLMEKPDNTSAKNWQQIEVGWTEAGLQVWCSRHNCNIVHIDFEGQRHPAV